MVKIGAQEELKGLRISINLKVSIRVEHNNGRQENLEPDRRSYLDYWVPIN